MSNTHSGVTIQRQSIQFSGHKHHALPQGPIRRFVSSRVWVVSTPLDFDFFSYNYHGPATIVRYNISDILLSWPSLILFLHDYEIWPDPPLVRRPM